MIYVAAKFGYSSVLGQPWWPCAAQFHASATHLNNGWIWVTFLLTQRTPAEGTLSANRQQQVSVSIAIEISLQIKKQGSLYIFEHSQKQPVVPTESKLTNQATQQKELLPSPVHSVPPSRLTCYSSPWCRCIWSWIQSRWFFYNRSPTGKCVSLSAQIEVILYKKVTDYYSRCFSSKLTLRTISMQ